MTTDVEGEFIGMVEVVDVTYVEPWEFVVVKTITDVEAEFTGNVEVVDVANIEPFESVVV